MTTVNSKGCSFIRSFCKRLQSAVQPIQQWLSHRIRWLSQCFGCAARTNAVAVPVLATTTTSTTRSSAPSPKLTAPPKPIEPSPTASAKRAPETSDRVEDTHTSSTVDPTKEREANEKAESEKENKGNAEGSKESSLKESPRTTASALTPTPQNTQKTSSDTKEKTVLTATTILTSSSKPTILPKAPVAPQGTLTTTALPVSVAAAAVAAAPAPEAPVVPTTGSHATEPPSDSPKPLEEAAKKTEEEVKEIGATAQTAAVAGRARTTPPFKALIATENLEGYKGAICGRSDTNVLDLLKFHLKDDSGESLDQWVRKPDGTHAILEKTEASPYTLVFDVPKRDPDSGIQQAITTLGGVYCHAMMMMSKQNLEFAITLLGIHDGFTEEESIRAFIEAIAALNKNSRLQQSPKLWIVSLVINENISTKAKQLAERLLNTRYLI